MWGPFCLRVNTPCVVKCGITSLSRRKFRVHNISNKSSSSSPALQAAGGAFQSFQVDDDGKNFSSGPLKGRWRPLQAGTGVGGQEGREREYEDEQ